MPYWIEPRRNCAPTSTALAESPNLGEFELIQRFFLRGHAANAAQYYKDLGEKVAIEVVTFGPGLHMLRDDTSPVKARIKTIKESTPAISFKACGNTQENMHKVENKEIPLIPEATVVKSGIVRVMELQEQGWTYVKP